MSRSLFASLALLLVTGAPSLAVQVITVSTAADTGAGSLRQAIHDANLSADPAPVQIHFAIASGAQAIAPVTAFEDIARPVVIDGTTQPGFAGTPLIELRGDSAPAGTIGLTLTGHSGSTIRGLVINRFKVLSSPSTSTGGFGILVAQNSNDHVIAGNYLGTNATGTAAAGNERGGIWCRGSNVTIGGTTTADRNVISGNFQYGIDMNSGTGVHIIGNYIGTNAAGSAAVGNGSGLFILDFSTNSIIGGDTPGERNLISGNGTNVGIGTTISTGHIVRGNWIGLNAAGTGVISTNSGVAINGGKQLTIERNVIAGSLGAAVAIGNTSSQITVQGNRIGTTPDGTSALPTSGIGVHVYVSASGSPVDVTIGGTSEGQGNVIRNCAGGGVVLISGIASNPQLFSAPKRIAIRGNAIDTNGGLGVDLDGDGVTANDAGDVDDDTVGSNFRQNFPAITSATASATTMDVHGTLDSIANATFDVDVFAAPTPDASGHGEAPIYLGLTQVQTNGSGHGTFSTTFAASLPSGMWISATATDAPGNTSEFSTAVQAQDDPINPPTTTTSTTTTTTTIATTTTTTVTTTTKTTTTTNPSTTTTSTSTTTTAPGTTSTTSASSTTTSAPATTTTSSVSTTTSTTTAGSSTTSTTQPCTLTGIPRVRCLLDQLPPSACDGLTLPTLVGRSLDTGRTLLDKAAATSGKPARRLLRRVAGRLGKTAAKVRRAGKSGKITPGCATALSGGLSNARSETTAVVVP